jgi:AbrB family looped-hinge helix DNA binding protein
MLKAKITSKGQITIPQTVRETLQLATGDELQFIITDQIAYIIPLNKSINKIKNLVTEDAKNKIRRN